jgi:hypothetical protein
MCQPMMMKEESVLYVLMREHLAERPQQHHDPGSWLQMMDRRDIAIHGHRPLE